MIRVTVHFPIGSKQVIEIRETPDLLTWVWSDAVDPDLEKVKLRLHRIFVPETGEEFLHYFVDAQTFCNLAAEAQIDD